MARPGVTYLDVAKAATTLQAEGKSPTVDKVRNHLGTGSKGTIAPHLKQWKSEQAPFLTDISHSTLPPDLISLVQGLWEGLQNKAQQQIETTEKKHQQQLDQQLQTHKKTLSQLQAKEQQCQQLKESLKSLQTEHESLQKNHQENVLKNEHLTGQLSELQHRIDDQKHNIKHLNEQSQKAYQNLEHFRKAAQQQREETLLQYDQNRSEWQNQQQILKKDLSATQQKNTDLEKNKLESQNTVANLKKEAGNLASQINDLSREKQALLASNDNLKKLMEAERQSQKALEMKITRLTQHNEHLTLNTTILQNNLDELSTMNQFLMRLKQEADTKQEKQRKADEIATN